MVLLPIGSDKLLEIRTSDIDLVIIEENRKKQNNLLKIIQIL